MFGLILTNLTRGKGSEADRTPVASDNYAGQLPTLPKIDGAGADTTSVPPGSGPAAAMTDPKPTVAPKAISSLVRPHDEPARGGVGEAVAEVEPSAPLPPLPPSDASSTPPRGDGPGTEVLATAGGGRVYVVGDRDSLIKIALKVYGAGHEKDYKAIYDANKAQLKDEAALRVGEKLVIPALSSPDIVARDLPPSRGTGASPTPVVGPFRADLRELESRFAGRATPTVAPGAGRATPTVAPGAARTPTPAAAAGRTYEIQAGDTLSKIARKMYKGDDSKGAIDKLMKINKIDSPTKLKIGDKLVVPT